MDPRSGFGSTPPGARAEARLESAEAETESAARLTVPARRPPPAIHPCGVRSAPVPAERTMTAPPAHPARIRRPRHEWGQQIRRRQRATCCGTPQGVLGTLGCRRPVRRRTHPPCIRRSRMGVSTGPRTPGPCGGTSPGSDSTIGESLPVPGKREDSEPRARPTPQSAVVSGTAGRGKSLHSRTLRISAS